MLKTVTRLSGLLACGLLVSCGTARKSASPPVGEWIRAQEDISWSHLQKNISPEEPKAEGGPKPRRGIVVAALHKKDPDYYFHWVRDSANVMRVVVERFELRPSDPQQLHVWMGDFILLSRDLQQSKSPYGMGDPRFTVEGEVDKLAWSRPQYDGPALRALAVLRYLDYVQKRLGPSTEAAKALLTTDLDYVTRVWNSRGFDLWEELKAENYHTRLVQLAALEQGAKRLGRKKYTDVAARLERQLDGHWDPKKGYLRSQMAIERTDGYTKKNTDLDSAVVVAVVESDRIHGGHSVMDDRVHATVKVLEDLFRSTFPINKDESLGLAYGRYRGDHYYGGNPWFLITAYYAQFYYRLAYAMAEGADFRITENNRAFVNTLLPQGRTVADKLLSIVKSGTPLHQELMAGCVTKADRILARVRAHTPPDGQLYEQFDKNTGNPASSRGIGWSHSAFIAASLERARLFEKLNRNQVLRN